MKIAIEAQRIFRVNKHGMDFVALEVIRELQKIDRENEYFILVNAGEDRCLEESENMHIVTVNAPLYPLWEQVCLPEAVRRIGPDILHCTGNTAPLRCDVPLVLTLHDIIFLEKRSGSSPSWYQNMGWYYRRFVVPRVLPKCRRIITVSNYERERIRCTADRRRPVGCRLQRVRKSFSSGRISVRGDSQIPTGERIPVFSRQYRSEEKYGAHAPRLCPVCPADRASAAAAGSGYSRKRD